MEWCTAVRQSDTMNIIILSLMLATVVKAGPTIYKIDQDEGTAERVMTAVSSTGQINPQSESVVGGEGGYCMDVG